MHPVAAGERSDSLDTLRGIALGGVLLVNLITGFRAPLAAHILGVNEPLGPGGALLLGILSALVEFKAFTLFSFLFGVGVAIQTQRVSESTANTTPFVLLIRRFAGLLLIGVVHLLLIWNGDILTLYAVCGLLLLPLLRLPDPVLAALGLCLILVPNLVSLPVPFPDPSTLRKLASEALETYRAGSWDQIAVFRFRETQLLIAPLLLLSLPRTLGLMLWGIAAWRSGLVQSEQRRECAGASVARESLLENRQQQPGHGRYAAVLGVVLAVIGIVTHRDEIATISLAFLYAAAVLLWNPRWPWLAAGGRMALTNYLLQSLVFSLVFYAHGLGLFGSVGVGVAMAGGLLLYIMQLAGSRWWLTRFRFGPAEWLWRSMTYRRWQPFLLADGWMISRTALRLLMVVTIVLVIPLIHLGTPVVLSQGGPHWGWNQGQPARINLIGGVPLIALGFALLVWILTTMLTAASARSLPAQVRIGLRPAFLLQAGPYLHMRHPMYVAETCFWAGAGVFLGSPVVIGLYLCLGSAGFAWVIRREEKALEEQFGEEYRAYRRRVPIVPRL